MRNNLPLLIIILVIFVNTLCAQSQKGYVVTTENDTIYGYLEFSMLDIKQNLLFFSDSGLTKTKYSPDELISFKKEDDYFDSRVCSRGELFMLRLINGPVSLYKYKKFSAASMAVGVAGSAVGHMPNTSPNSNIVYYYFVENQNGNSISSSMVKCDKDSLCKVFSDYSLLTELIRNNEVKTNMTSMIETYNHWKLNTPEGIQFFNHLNESKKLFNNDELIYSFIKDESTEEYADRVEKLLKSNYFVQEIRVYKKEHKNGEIKSLSFRAMFNKAGYTLNMPYDVGCKIKQSENGEIIKMEKYDLQGLKIL